MSCCTLLGELDFCDTDVRAVSQHKSVESLSLYKRVKVDRMMDMALSMAGAIGLSTQIVPIPPIIENTSSLELLS